MTNFKLRWKLSSSRKGIEVNTELINDSIFDLIESEARQNILPLLIQNSLLKQEPNDLYWLEVSDALSGLSIYKACCLGFLSQGLDAPRNSPFKVIERQIRVAHANDIGLSIINDLQNLLLNDKEKIDASIISCPSLAAIFLQSQKLLYILKTLSSGNLIITVNVNVMDNADQITFQHGSLFFSDLVIRKVLHKIGFKRIRCNDGFEHTESWKHESKLVAFKDENFKPINSRVEESDGFQVKTYVCDLGLHNV